MYSVIRAKRKERGLTQKELATLVGCSQTHISDAENSIYGLSTDLAEKISSVLNIEKETLLYPNKGTGITNSALFKLNKEKREQRRNQRSCVIQKNNADRRLNG
ncbi:helix-turn-helix transcriptional regulator [Neisseria dumasiana]|uniref:HTH cro/C1-type domain-containing protein n=1 Tax=Neisseria dumasiana TaxID=1931275 RepID=A0A1X3DIQ3_9NEIS|nr:helix-turn-helix transcriptional regulator [Neisseria dumasiana]OSI20419.1 hypothetical protein BV912_07565 [Neisseria dumasiana]